MAKAVVIMLLLALCLWCGGQLHLMPPIVEKIRARITIWNHETGAITAGRKQETIEREALRQKETQVNQLFLDMDREVRKLKR